MLWTIVTCLSAIAGAATLPKRSLENGVALRIQPLGDSITYGYLSSTGNGYLLELLSGNSVDYIGSQRNGNMANNHNEGWPGYHINDIVLKAQLSLPDSPNVILMMAGTNDMIYNDNVSEAPSRLGGLIDECIRAAPDAVIIVAQLTPLANSNQNSAANTYNAAIPGVVQQRANAGHKVLMVNMQNLNDGLTVAALKDGTHPTDAGYIKMAHVWLDGLNQAAASNWITPQSTTDAENVHDQCSAEPFWNNNYGTFAWGIGSADTEFTPNGTSVGQVASGDGAGSGVRVADFDGDGRDDIAWVL